VHWFGDLWTYIWAVVNNWAGYATGGLIVASLALRQWLQPDWKASKKSGILLVSVSLFLATFQAWKDQHARADNAEAKVLQLQQYPDPIIRKALGELVDEGQEIKREWDSHFRREPMESQLKSASQVQPWHDKVEAYLKTLPNGDSYLRRFKVSPGGNGTWPLGINYEAADQYNLLVNDLNRLSDFIADPNLGKP
jgi:hypothetical protein